MNVDALVFEINMLRNYRPLQVNSLAYFKAEYWVHSVDYASEHMNGDRTEENEHDRTIHLQSEYEGGDSIKKKEKPRRISEIRDMHDIRYVYSTGR
jgi:hypothetical protein